jgi:tRNA (guanine37-N1)-methyltransferase
VNQPAARLRIDVFTLFPGTFAGPLDESILKRARAASIVDIAIHDLREWTRDRHRTADDTPYGGGPGMVMLAPPIVEGVEATLGADLGRAPIRVMSAAGRLFTQEIAGELAQASRLALICGHYEGIDQRAIDLLGAEELSIGDYVLTGGELPAMVVIDAVCRLVPGAIESASVEDESHVAGLLEYPHYTRPAVYRDLAVPPVLLSGHHAEIARWRRRQAIDRTARRRPELLARATLTATEREIAAHAQSAEREGADSDG